MTEKEALFQYCQNYVQQRIDSILEEIKVVQLASNEDTKSSAGDKYETGKAMAQLEVERNLGQLKEAEKLKSILQKITSSGSRDRIAAGSLVTTSRGVFYIAISLGLTVLDKKSYFIVSADSPIGKLLQGKQVDDRIAWSGSEFVIETID